MKGPVYWHPALYQLAMRRLYGAQGFQQRYRVVAQQVPPGCDVVDLCAGDGLLRHHLPPGTEYLAVDINAAFLDGLRKQGVRVVLVIRAQGRTQFFDLFLDEAKLLDDGAVGMGFDGIQDCGDGDHRWLPFMA